MKAQTQRVQAEAVDEQTQLDSTVRIDDVHGRSVSILTCDCNSFGLGWRSRHRRKLRRR